MGGIADELRATMERLGLKGKETKQQIQEAIKVDRQRRDYAARKLGIQYTRAAAKAMDLLTYTGGKSCSLAGHGNLRRVSNGACVECLRTGTREGMRKKRAASKRVVRHERWVNQGGRLVKIKEWSTGGGC